MSTNRWRNHHMATRDKILEFIIEFVESHGYSPSYREIGDATNIRSTSTVGSYIRELIEEGALSSDRSKARTLALAAADESREVVSQRICVQVADGGRLYMDCVLEKPRSSHVRVTFEGVLDAQALRSPVSKIVDVRASNE